MRGLADSVTARWVSRVRNGWRVASGAARRRGRLVIAVSVGAVAATAVWVVQTLPTTTDVRLRAASMELEALRGYVDAGVSGSVVPPGGLMIVVRERLVGDILDQILPYEHTFDGRLALRFDSASVEFQRGLARIELHGRGSLPARPDILADMTVSGLLAVEGLSEQRDALRTRAEVLGFRFDDVDLGGISPPLLRASERLAGEILHEVGHFMDQIEVPVRLARSLDLPPVRDDDVTIAGVTVPIEIEVREIFVLAGRLWIALGAQMGAPSSAVAAAGEATPETGASGP